MIITLTEAPVGHAKAGHRYAHGKVPLLSQHHMVNSDKKMLPCLEGNYLQITFFTAAITVTGNHIVVASGHFPPRKSLGIWPENYIIYDSL